MDRSYVRFGSKAAYAAQRPMSALPPKADICSALAHVRYGPIADIFVSLQLTFQEHCFADAQNTALGGGHVI
jgi:hypothetical protein